MPSPDTTSWNLIAAAGAGASAAREEFAKRYEPAVRSWLRQRWTTGPLRDQLDDAVQEVFVECIKPDGVLSKADPSFQAGFRALLGGVTRKVALRFEERARHARALVAQGIDTAVQTGAEHSSAAHPLDRAWALEILREAAIEQERRAAEVGMGALRRVEILKLRFQEGLTTAEIASALEVDPEYAQHQFAKARRDFLRALQVIVARRNPDLSKRELLERCRQLVTLLRSSA
ncbi:MAG: sigma-70 family RNA polymerase sigma factor [Planctomycetes bacterium]|nr:sigma-70 family RNA polymerase sigma factor [Planctomycetota bacterium]